MSLPRRGFVFSLQAIAQNCDKEQYDCDDEHHHPGAQ